MKVLAQVLSLFTLIAYCSTAHASSAKVSCNDVTAGGYGEFSFVVDLGQIPPSDPVSNTITAYKSKSPNHLFSYCDAVNFYRGRIDFKCTWEPYGVYRGHMSIYQNDLASNSSFQLEFTEVDEESGQANGTDQFSCKTL